MWHGTIGGGRRWNTKFVVAVAASVDFPREISKVFDDSRIFWNEFPVPRWMSQTGPMSEVNTCIALCGRSQVQWEKESVLDFASKCLGFRNILCTCFWTTDELCIIFCSVPHALRVKKWRFSATLIGGKWESRFFWIGMSTWVIDSPFNRDNVKGDVKDVVKGVKGGRMGC